MASVGKTIKECVKGLCDLKARFAQSRTEKLYTRFFENAEKLTSCVKDVLHAFFARGDRADSLSRKIKKLYKSTYSAVFAALLLCAESIERGEKRRAAAKAKEISIKFMSALPKVFAALKVDAQATFSNDPAAESVEGVLLSYPGIEATLYYRIAHVLYNLKVPYLPRRISETAHSKTGIDIHPGAEIAEGFFIDHGTGIVIGETTVIGKNVKIYQGVTLGAKSLKGARSLGGVKRHPTICDGATIYSGATILGGETVIEKGEVIGCGKVVAR